MADGRTSWLMPPSTTLRLHRVDMTSEATAAKDAASATTTFSLKPQHADSPDFMLVFRWDSTRSDRPNQALEDETSLTRVCDVHGMRSHGMCMADNERGVKVWMCAVQVHQGPRHGARAQRVQREVFARGQHVHRQVSLHPSVHSQPNNRELPETDPVLKHT